MDITRISSEYTPKPVHKRSWLSNALTIISYTILTTAAVVVTAIYGPLALGYAPFDMAASLLVGALLGLVLGISKVHAYRREYKKYGEYRGA